MNEKLLTYLVNHGLLTPAQADKIRADFENTGRSVRELLAEGGQVTEEQLTEALSEVYRMPMVRLYEHQIPVEVRAVVRADILREHAMLPFGFDENEPGTLLVAMNDPMNIRGRDLVAIASRCRIRPYLATTTDIMLTIDRYYGTEEMQFSQYTRKLKACIDEWTKRKIREEGK